MILLNAKSPVSISLFKRRGSIFFGRGILERRLFSANYPFGIG